MRKTLIKGAFILLAGGLAACAPYHAGQAPYGDGGYAGDPGQGGYGQGMAPGQTVEVLGCAVPGVENRCTMLRGADGRSWNIAGAQPSPQGAWAIRASGRISADATSYCQGPMLSEVRWEYANLRCVEGRVQGYSGD